MRDKILTLKELDNLIDAIPLSNGKKYFIICNYIYYTCPVCRHENKKLFDNSIDYYCDNCNALCNKV